MGYASLTRSELAEGARERGLPTGGTKADLVQRLLAWDAQHQLLDPGLQQHNQPDPEVDTQPRPVVAWASDGSNHPADGVARKVATGECVVVFPLGIAGLTEEAHDRLLAATLTAGREAGFNARAPRCVGLAERPGGRVAVYSAIVKAPRQEE